MNQTNQKEPCYEEMKPYEKFMAKGPEYLSEEELLAIIIRTGTRTMDALQLAKQVLASARAGKKGCSACSICPSGTFARSTASAG